MWPQQQRLVTLEASWSIFSLFNSPLANAAGATATTAVIATDAGLKIGAGVTAGIAGEVVRDEVDVRTGRKGKYSLSQMLLFSLCDSP